MGRTWNTKVDGSAFDEKTIEAVWEKGIPERGHPYFQKRFLWGFDGAQQIR